MLLYDYTPGGENTYWPGCTFHSATEKLGYALHCPGCGATRCCHALVHGDLLQALAWNSLFVLFVPYFAFSLFQVAFSLWTGRRAPSIKTPRWTGYFVGGLLLAYWIARNIPVEPFTYLAPHSLS
jgi:hypothetical protein